MNQELIKRYNHIIEYYNVNENYPYYKGYYDFLILKEYLSLFENFLFIEDENNKYYEWRIFKDNMFTVDKVNNKIYIEKDGINLSSNQIEFSEFISKYGYNFYKKYDDILKKLSYPSLKRLIFISIYNCSFCDNFEKNDTFIIENIFTRQGYQYCAFCERFAKDSFQKNKIKKHLDTFKLYSKVVGKLLNLYHTVKLN
jgi:hypothetical protein